MKIGEGCTCVAACGFFFASEGSGRILVDINLSLRVLYTLGLID